MHVLYTIALILISIPLTIIFGPDALLIWAPILLYILFPTIRTFFISCIRSWKARKYTGETTGEIIENKRTEHIRFHNYIEAYINRTRYQWYNEELENYKEFLYSTLIKYKVRGKSYIVDLGESNYKPSIVGRRVKVLYDENEPSKADILRKRKYKKHIRVIKRDGMYIYCQCGLRKNIELLSELVDERAMPGMFLVEQYGYYHLEDATERRRSFIEKMENSILPGTLEDQFERDQKY